MTPWGLKIYFYINFPLTVLSYAILSPGYRAHIIGSKNAKVLPDPLIALTNKLNFFLAGSNAIYIVYSCTFVGLRLFCLSNASIIPSCILKSFHFFFALIYVLSVFYFFSIFSSTT